jgi:hypothetical protein
MTPLKTIRTTLVSPIFRQFGSSFLYCRISDVCSSDLILQYKKELPNCLKIAETSVVLIVFNAYSIFSSFLFLFCFFVIKNLSSRNGSCRFYIIASNTWTKQVWRNLKHTPVTSLGANLRIWKKDIDLRYRCLWRMNRTWIWGLDVD